MIVMSKVKVTICGREYSLQTDESPEYIIALAARVDKEINDLVKTSPNFGIQNAAVFTALTALDEAQKANSSIDNIRSQIKAYVDDAAKARASEARLKAEVKELRELRTRIAELEKENKELKKKLSAYDCEQLVLENTIEDTVTVYTGSQSAENEKAAQKKEVPPSDTEPKAQSASSGGNGQTNEENAAEKPVGNDESGTADRETQNDGGAPLHDDLTPEKNKRKGKKKKR